MKSVRGSILKIAGVLFLVSISLGSFLGRSAGRLVFAGDSPLDVSWEDEPLFDYDKLAPGDDISTQDIEIKNTSEDTAHTVYFGAVKTGAEKGLPEKLEVKLTSESGDPYWEGNLDDLFDLAEDHGCADIDDMDEDCAVDLGITLAPGKKTTVKMSINLDKDLGNEYQDAEVTFDLLAGFIGAGEVAGALVVPEGEVLGALLPATGEQALILALAGLCLLSAGLLLRRRTTRPHF